MANLKTGRIYRIIHNESDIVYIGSTFNRLSDRFNSHKHNFKQFLNNKHGEIAIYPYFEKFGIENFTIILIKEFQCIDRKHLLAYEQLYINKLNCINKQCAFNILRKEYSKQYYEQNKDKKKKYDKQYREQNKDKKKKYFKQYYEQNKENSKQHRERNKDKRNQYFKQYREQNKEYFKQYREQNKDKRNQKINCECGGKYTLTNKTIHEKTKKHLNYLEKKNN